MGRKLTPEEKEANKRKEKAFSDRMDAYRKAKYESEKKLSPLLQALDVARDGCTQKTAEKARLLAEAKARHEQECRAINESLDPLIESLRKERERISREYDTARLNASREVDNAFPDLKGVNHWRNWIEPK